MVAIVLQWGSWHLYRTNIGVGEQGLDCGVCAPNGCDHACSAGGVTQTGRCAVPGSTDPAHCCECAPYVEDMPCATCAESAGGCVALCLKAGHSAGGMCKYGDHSANGLCCECFDG